MRRKKNFGSLESHDGYREENHDEDWYLLVSTATLIRYHTCTTSILSK